MGKIRLQHNGASVSLDIAPDAAKPRNHTPLRFRVGYGVSVSPGVDTFFLSRETIDKLQSDVLNEILHSKEPGYDIVVQNAEERVQAGALDLLTTVRKFGMLTHPDILMLVDMQSHSTPPRSPPSRRPGRSR